MLSQNDQHMPMFTDGIDSADFPPAVVTSADRVSAAQYGWAGVFGDFADWILRLSEKDLPSEFQLHPGCDVVDVARFLAHLQLGIREGPEGVRARTGSLQADMLRLREILHHDSAAFGSDSESGSLCSGQAASLTRDGVRSDNFNEEPWLPTYPSGQFSGKSARDCPTRFLIWDVANGVYRNWQLREAVIAELERRYADPRELYREQIADVLKSHAKANDRPVREENEQ